MSVLNKMLRDLDARGALPATGTSAITLAPLERAPVESASTEADAFEPAPFEPALREPLATKPNAVPSSYEPAARIEPTAALGESTLNQQHANLFSDTVHAYSLPLTQGKARSKISIRQATWLLTLLMAAGLAGGLAWMEYRAKNVKLSGQPRGYKEFKSVLPAVAAPSNTAPVPNQLAPNQTAIAPAGTSGVLPKPEMAAAAEQSAHANPSTKDSHASYAAVNKDLKDKQLTNNEPKAATVPVTEVTSSRTAIIASSVPSTLATTNTNSALTASAGASQVKDPKTAARESSRTESRRVETSPASLTAAAALPPQKDSAKAVDSKPAKLATPQSAPLRTATAAASATADTQALPKESEVSVPAVRRSASSLNDPNTDVARAAQLIAQGRSSEALPLLKSVLTRDPLQHSARSALAALQAEAGQRVDALSTLLEGSQVDPARFALQAAQLQAEVGDATAALVTLERVPNGQRNPSFYALGGGIALRAGDAQQSIQLYKRALTAPDANVMWWVGLGLAHEAANQMTDAHAAFAKLAKVPNLPADVKNFVQQKLTELNSH